MKRRLVSVLTIVVLLAVAALGVAAVASAADWPTVKPVMAVTTDGATATFVILVQNNSTSNVMSEDIRAALYGATLLRTWAGNPEVHRAKSYGDSVGWINRARVLAGRAQGPFVFQVNLSSDGQAMSHTWLRVKTDTFDADVTGDLVTVVP